MLVRRATADDAAGAVAVLRESITQLCVADHQNDGKTLSRWLANKTVDHFLTWMSDINSFLIVAEQGGSLCGVALLTRSGSLNLCYVRPGWQRRGAGTALVHALEAQAQAWGLNQVRLLAARDAIPFYEHCGYVPSGRPTPGFGRVVDIPYHKTLRT